VALLSTSRFVAFGRIARAHGLRGEVRLVPLHPETELPEGIERVRLQPAAGEPLFFTVRSVRPTTGALLVCFAEVQDRDAAEALRGATLEIEVASLPPLEPGELYLYELIGAEAVDGAARPLGVVESLLDNHGQDVLVLRGPQGEERLLPLEGGSLVHFDREARRVELSVPEGLWEP
jgi:16S rRNA processing protein RimM